MSVAARDDALHPADTPEPVVSARSGDRADGQAAPDPGHIRVLVVATDDGTAPAVRRRLEESGHEFEIAGVAATGQAMAQASVAETDVVLVDMTGVREQALEAVATLHARVPELPIIVLRGAVDEDAVREALGAGACDHLANDHAGGELLARAVLHAVERRRLQAAARESKLEVEAARDRAVRMQGALEASEKRRRMLLGSMLRAEEAERQRVAVELHDDTIQVMVAALVGMDACQATIERDDPGGAVESIARARATLSSAVERVRRMTFELRPPLLDAQGLGAAALDLLAQVAAECELETHSQISLRRYTPEIEILAFRTLRELIANVRKHAFASRLELELRDDGTAIVCVVADDGVGFDLERIRGRRHMRLHPGLDATVERVRLAGGTFTIDSGERGTTVTFTVPIHRQGDVRSR